MKQRRQFPLRLQFFALFFLAFSLVDSFAADLTIGTRTNSSNVVPFGVLPSASTPCTRYQQVYNASGFMSVGMMQINSLSFIGGNGGNFRPGTYTFSFSTKTNGVDSLSNSSFDSNLGANNAFFVSVFLSGAAPATLTFSGAPFLYDPSAGNLLLDLSISPAGSQPSGRIVSYASDSPPLGTGVFSRYDNFTTGNYGFGLITVFHYDLPVDAVTPVPEPSFAGLMGMAAVVSRLIRKK